MAKEAFAGAGLGLLVGLLLGMSSTSVAGVVVAALTAGLGAFFGLARSDGPDRTVRIGCFGLACAIAAIGGLVARSGPWLERDVASEVARWTKAQYSPDEARTLVAFQLLGIRPTGREVGPVPPSPLPLFAGHSDLCARLERLPDQAMLDVLRSDADRAGLAIAAAVEAAPAPNQPAVMHAGVKSLCG